MDENFIILGNGFDLDLGLNTSFKSFHESTEFNQIPDISFVKDMRDNNWSDVEGCIRKHILKYSQSHNEKDAEDINYAWKCVEKQWAVFLTEQIELDQITINKTSCAYSFLKDDNIKAKWISFNYTHPRYLCKLSGEEPICIHKGCVERDFAKENGLAYLISTDLIIGIDSSMPNNVLTNRYLSPIIKANSRNIRLTDITTSLSEANRIVIFGHSLGITDSDYFKEFFLRCMNNVYSGKTIYIVTYNKDSLEGIKKNLRSYNIDYNKLCSSSNKLITIYTEKGVSRDFREMVASLY